MLTPNSNSCARETSPNKGETVMTPIKISEPEIPKPRKVSISDPLCGKNPEISRAQASASINNEVTDQTPGVLLV